MIPVGLAAAVMQLPHKTQASSTPFPNVKSRLVPSAAPLRRAEDRLRPPADLDSSRMEAAVK